MLKETLHNKLGVKYPIIQAPMAGVTTPEFVAAVSNNGALGNIGAGYLSATETEQYIKGVKKLTQFPFGINLFVPEHHTVLETEIDTAYTLMKTNLEKLGKTVEDMPNYESNSEFEKQIDILLTEGVPVCSFTFGIPDKNIIKELKNNGTYIIGTATTVQEAQLVEQAGMDAVVVQGSEAGGHRGTFNGEEKLVGTMALIPQAVDHVSIPIIAAGGIMDGRGLLASLSLGAEAAQYGTAFLTTKECGTHPLHKEAILNASEEDMRLTKAFSGKTARGINNEFIKAMEPYEKDLPPFPFQNAFTRDIRNVAANQGNIEYMSLWSGQGARLTKAVTVKQLISEIINEYNTIRANVLTL